MKKPKSIIDLVLEEQEVKQQLNNSNTESKESAAVLRADESQLDIAIAKRNKIFRERVRVQPEKAKKKSSSLATNLKTEASDGLYGLSNIAMDQANLKLLPDRKNQVPIHQPAQRQKQYNVVRKLLHKPEQVQKQKYNNATSPRREDSMDSQEIDVTSVTHNSVRLNNSNIIHEMRDDSMINEDILPELRLEENPTYRRKGSEDGRMSTLDPVSSYQTIDQKEKDEPAGPVSGGSQMQKNISLDAYDFNGSRQNLGRGLKQDSNMININKKAVLPSTI